MSDGSTPPAVSSLSGSQIRGTVLVVDDNADMLGYVSRILSDGGFDVSYWVVVMYKSV